MDSSNQYLLPSPEQKRNHRPSRLAKLGGVLVLIGASFGIGWLVSTEPSTVEATPVVHATEQLPDDNPGSDTGQVDPNTALSSTEDNADSSAAGLISELDPPTMGGTDTLGVDNQFSTLNQVEGTGATPDINLAEVDEEDYPVKQRTDEPVADVAEALIPSMVSIEVAGRFGNTGQGSGVIFSEDGLIMTAEHVVQGSDEVTVRLADGERITGTVLGGDNNYDIAVVRIDRDGLQPAVLGIDEEVRVGELVVAIGNPWGLQSSVTAGVVSAINRPVSDRNGFWRSAIQTDAPINPGNSGGALVDRNGLVIGINVLIYTQTGENSGVGFAVPIRSAFQVAQAIIDDREIQNAYLGVEGIDSTEGRGGAVLLRVLPETPAARAELQADDLVVSIAGFPVTSFQDLAALIRSFQPGDVVQLELIRDDEQLTVDVELSTRPE